MTGYTVHTGSSDKFREGWDQIFKGKKTSGTRKPEAEKKSGKVAGSKKHGKTRSSK